MALPQIATPEFETVVPSTKETITFRPFLVKEEKILYMALEGGEQNDIYNAVTKTLENCIISDCNIKKLSSFDVEYLFLQLRGKSVGEVITLKLKHPQEDSDCDHAEEIEIDIDSVKMKEDPRHNKIVQLNENLGIQFRYPTMSDVLTIGEGKNDLTNTFDLIASCVDNVFDADNVYDDFTKEEIIEFIENLSKPQFEKASVFFESMPKLQHDLEWTCSECKKEEKISLEGLQSFFELV
jgi:hypothetical protein